jgi:hypothetical protein
MFPRRVSRGRALLGVVLTGAAAARLAAPPLLAAPVPLGTPVQLGSPVQLGTPVPLGVPPGPAGLLASLRPDYPLYIATLRPMPSGPFPSPGAAAIYMALVRPGAADPTRGASAPFAGPGARNDILYDSSSVSAGRSTGWATLLLDHEYFHARHLAGATSLPLPWGAPAEVERHFYEAAAWGFNVAEARAGRYPGLRPDEFREALDRYGEHYRALRALSGDRDPDGWRTMSDLLTHPPLLVRNAAAAPRRSEDRARPSGWGRSAAIP